MSVLKVTALRAGYWARSRGVSAYQRLIAEHLDFAEHVLSSHIATRDAPARGAGPSAD